MKVQKGRGRINNIARKQGLAHSKEIEKQNPIIGLKRQGSLIFSEGEENAARKKKCDGLVGSFNEEDI